MPILRLILSALLLMPAACATTPAAPTGPLYYVMRHLHTPAGERDPDLLPEGMRQSALLVDRFGAAPPAIIYVSSYKRTQQSAAALAAAHRLTPVIYDPADTSALLARVRQGPFPVLIVGHSNTVPDIVAGLGGERPAPLVHEDFGDLWRIGADGVTRRFRIADDVNVTP